MAEHVRLLNNDEVASLVEVESCFDSLETAFRDLGHGNAASVRRHDVLSSAPSLNAINSFKSMSGVVPSLDAACLRVDSDLLRMPGDDGDARREKLTKSQEESVRIGKENGLLMLYQISTGELLAILTDGEIQRLRVGVTSALAAKYLANPNCTKVAFLGTGYQADTQFRALAVLIPAMEAKVFSPNRAHLEEFVSRMSETTGCKVEAVSDAEEAVDSAEILVSATNSLKPTIKPEWITPGMHINCIKKQEVDLGVLEKCDVVVVGSTGDTVHVVVGDLRYRKLNETAPGWWKDPDHAWESYPFLADVIAGVTTGRSTPEQTTCYIGHGTGIQFAAIAMLAYQRAVENEVGFLIPSNRFLQPILQR
ncbi:MAG: ornithine cyclodeaminase family protein [Acidimicrobiaceae bacterium]|nr:ornithine cyclodeaminase family protein [Acidimicrobiaceae bacterium]